MLVQLADQLEKALPFMATPESVKVELTLSGADLNLQDLAKALANIRAAVKSAQSGTEPAANVG
ncbi:hypothetical protein D3C76_1310070 [compost metagenome]